MKKTTERNKRKSYLTYSIIPKYEKEIKAYIDNVNETTGATRAFIVSTILMDAIRDGKKFLPFNSKIQ